VPLININQEDNTNPNDDQGVDRSLLHVSQYIRDSRVPVEQPQEIASNCSCSSGESTGLSQEETLEQNSYISRQGIQSEQELLSPVTLTADEAEEDMPATAEEISQTILSSENRIAPIGELSLTVGPDGGNAQRGDLSLSVPAGAVDEEVTLLAKVYIDKQVFPPVDISKEQFIFSPVLSLEPHGYRFKKPVLVRLPFSAVLEGWHLFLLRADCPVEEDARTWKQIISYNTDTREVITDDCLYDVHHALLSVSHFCRHSWCAEALLKEGKTDFNSKKILYCSIYGISDGSLNRWHLELNLHDRCDDISKTILENYERLDPQWKILGYQGTLTIARRGEIRCEVVSRIWQLTGTIQPQPFEYYWSSWFGNHHKIQFCIECPPETPVQNAGGINIKVHGCSNTAPAVFFVMPVLMRSQDQAPLNPPVERCGSVDSGSYSEIGLAVAENYQARTLQPTGQDNPESSIEDLSTKASRKVTPGELVAVAKQISGSWTTLAIFLAPDLFTRDVLSVLKKRNAEEIVRARTVLEIWSVTFPEKANCGALIKALCKSKCKAEAVKVFSSSLVDFVTKQREQ
jgi:hypothetical protein